MKSKNMTDQELKQEFAKILYDMGINYLRVSEGEIWINGMQVTEHGEIIQ